MARKLWLPTDTERVAWRCRICSHPFGENEYRQFENHVIECGEANAQRLHEMSPRTKLPDLYDEIDPEMGSYYRRQRARGG